MGAESAKLATLEAYGIPLPLAVAWSKGYLTDKALEELGRPVGGPCLFVQNIIGSRKWRELVRFATGQPFSALCFRAHHAAVEKMARRWKASPMHPDADGRRYFADGDTLAAWLNHLRGLAPQGA